MFPDPDTQTTERLMGHLKLHGAENIGKLSAEIMSANVCFLIGSVGPQATAEILREWAGHVQRKAMKVAS